MWRTSLAPWLRSEWNFRFQGRGLFGDLGRGGSSVAVDEVDGDLIYKWGDRSGRPYSMWGSDADERATRMGARPLDGTGTNVTVLGFSDPGSGEQPDPDELATEMAKLASKWFWPAMLRGTLEVTIEAPSETIEVAPDTCKDVTPFLQCLRNRNAAGNVLEGPGSVAVKSPTFEIEDKAADAIDQDEDPTTASGPVDVYVRLADPEREKAMTNKVALVRGSGMVVKYYDRNRVVYGGRDFHGVVLAGEARPWTDGTSTQADSDIDDFLTAAEPPKHNDWKDTKRLKEQYERGARGTVLDFQRSLITEAIRELVRQTRREGRLVAGRLAERLNIPDGRGEGTVGGPGDGGGGSSAVQGTAEISYDHTADRWHFSGHATVKESDYDVWEIEVKIRRLDEERRTVGTVPINSITVSGVESAYRDISGDVAVVRVGDDVSGFSFRGESDVDHDRLEVTIDVNGAVFMRGDAR